ncbi:MAG: glycosyltransferase family 2 protein [Bacteroidetes bacterium]|nr:glycosyltransferase family 2 protein [Bacteroidota bacterium]
MKLSIVIVNYNVKHFFRQCLNSVILAAKTLSYEIICIDNHSVDGSSEMISKDFPQIKLIKNDINLGFGKACNQGIKIAQGEYILILNPDTVLENDSLTKPIIFMDAHPEAGSLGVKMLDGNGKFLPESKRGLPTPAAAFYKMSGLSKLFFPSRIFGKYYLDQLNKDEIQSVHVLTGAYMLIRKSVLEKTGYFDEQFFMYGEDVDLSHRIIQAGYKNYYFPETRIIHYKGESTKKESIEYVYSFYRAMLIFSKKHFSKNNTKTLSILIRIAIISSAAFALIKRMLNGFFLPILDFIIFGLGIIFITKIWETLIIYPEGGSYPFLFYQLIIPIYILIWLATLYFSGGYDKPFKPKKIVWAIVIGTILILLGYSLLNETWRFSRSIILLGALWGLTSLTSFRLILGRLGLIQYGHEPAKRIFIIGKIEEANRITNILLQSDIKPEFHGYVSPDNKTINDNKFIGSITQIEDLVKDFNINELIFCSKDISYQQIIDIITALQSKHLICKIAPENSFSIIGSKSISSTEDLYTQKINIISNPSNIRAKRNFDLIVTFVLILSIPYSLFIIPSFYGFIKNIFRVLINKISWVGYHPQDNSSLKLPVIKRGVLHTTDGIKEFIDNQKEITALNIDYTQNYHFKKDLHIVYQGFKKLGRQ